MIDIVYVLGTGSTWNNNEIRYSLRSIEKHLFQYRNVYIIGECPEFLQNVIHIPYADEHKNRETRIALKILRACKEKTISNEFLFMNDDHFLLSNYSADNFPFYQKGILLEEINIPNLNEEYKLSLKNTLEVLTRKLTISKYPKKNFDVHTPMLIDKSFFVKIFNSFDWEIPGSYVVKSIYCNCLNFNFMDTPYMEDCKVSRNYDYTTLEAIVHDKKIFSIGDSAIGDSLEKLLNHLYPVKSKYEK